MVSFSRQRKAIAQVSKRNIRPAARSTSILIGWIARPFLGSIQVGHCGSPTRGAFTRPNTSPDLPERSSPAADTLVRMSLYAERQSRAGSVELPLFPSRSRQRDPRPQVGPTVRIHFPPAASPVRTALLRHFEENAQLGGRQGRVRGATGGSPGKAVRPTRASLSEEKRRQSAE